MRNCQWPHRMLKPPTVYLDTNSGAPLGRETVRALLSFLESESDSGSQGVIPGNASSLHRFGRQAKKIIHDARFGIARSIGLTGSTDDSTGQVFTSSGTEANQLAIRSVLEPWLAWFEGTGTRPCWIVSSVEHDSVREMIPWFEDSGGEVRLLPVNRQGVIEFDPDLPQAKNSGIAPTAAPVLISVIWVQNETGVITDLNPILAAAAAHGIPVHVDAAQAWGKIPIQLDAPGEGGDLSPISYLTLSGHKIGALPGTGVLVYRSHPGRPPVLPPIRPMIRGKQESGNRGGTENLSGILSMGAAAGELRPLEWAEHIRPLRDRMEHEIQKRIPGTRIHGGETARVANTSNLGFDGIENDRTLVADLDLAGYAVSAGSACSSGVSEPSSVLLAMGVSAAQAVSAVRISLSDRTAWADLEGLIGALEKAVSGRRKTK